MPCGGAVFPESPEVQKAFLSPGKWNTHPIEQVDDGRSHFAHSLHRFLVGEKIASVDRVIEMLPRGIPLAFGVDGSVDPALGAN